MIEIGTNAPDELQADVCVVGSGPAGMTAALELERRGVGCVLLESGKLEPSVDHTLMNEVEQVGIQTDVSTHNRMRALGGTSNLWLGVCRPLDPVDFERRSWIPQSGWPIESSDLEPYYARAHRILGLPAPDYDLQSLQSRGVDPGRSLDDRDFYNFVFYRTNPPFRFGEHYEEHLRSSRFIDVFVDSTVVDVETENHGQRVASVTVSTLGGRRFKVRAGRFVLAAGAVQNARLLLNSNREHQNGLGNHHDMVGRNFLQHPVLFRPRMILLDPARRADLVRDGKLNTVVTTGIKPAVAGDHGLLNFHFFFRDYTPIHRTGPATPTVGELVLRFVDQEVVSRSRGMSDVPEFLQQLRPVLAPDAPGHAAWASLEMRPEQAPNFESRITLSEQRDAMGLRLARMDWRLTEIDQTTMRTGLKLLSNRVAWHGIGRVQSRPDQHTYPGRNAEVLHGGHHHYGTARMGDSERTSVVDSDCRVHGLANLYVAGSAVFPTTGQVNPTLSIVALSSRLAEHLAQLEQPTRIQTVAAVP